MPEDKTLDCIENNSPETLVPLSKAFGSLAYIHCFHILKNLPQNDSMDLNNSAEVFVDFMTDFIGKDAAKYMEHDSVDDAIDSYLEACQWLVEHKVKNREEILELFLLFILPSESLLRNTYNLNDLSVYIRGNNCLAFIIEPLKLSQEKVYQTISGVDEGLSLYFNGLAKELEWRNKTNCLLRPVFISMLYPEILEPHFKAMTAGTAIIFDFDKIKSLEEMSDYIELVNNFSEKWKYPPDFNTDEMCNYNSQEDALQAYTEVFEELCRQCPADAKAVLQRLVIAILISTDCGDITEEGTPEQFNLVKDLSRPLKLTDSELKAVIDRGVQSIVQNVHEQI